MNRIKKLMLIEDNRNDRYFFKMVLHDMNPAIDLLEFSSCPEAINALHDMTILPDFIFMDSHLPQMSGMECLEELKQDSRLLHIPIIIYSGSENPGEEGKFLEKGAAYFLTKKNDYEELPPAIREAIGKVRDDEAHSGQTP
jgi:CheY-like chemotaxis protein